MLPLKIWQQKAISNHISSEKGAFFSSSLMNSSPSNYTMLTELHLPPNLRLQGLDEGSICCSLISNFPTPPHGNSNREPLWKLYYVETVG